MLAELIPSIGYLGAGNMAGALLRGTVGRGLMPAAAAWARDVDPQKVIELHSELKIQIADDAAQLLKHAEMIVLAVKPQTMNALLDEIAPHAGGRHVFVSIAAGIPLSKIAARLPAQSRLIRVMPNTPSLIGLGAAGVARGEFATAKDLQAALALFNAVGVAREVDEADLDAVTALSGSGPAYVFKIIELMDEAGREMGLSTETARELTLQTVLGAARLAMDSGIEPAELRRRVTSPGGTTAAALDVMEQKQMAEIFKSALHRARARAAELAAG